MKPVVMFSSERYILSDEGLVYLKLEKMFLVERTEPMHQEQVRLLGNILHSAARRHGMSFKWPFIWNHWSVGFMIEDWLPTQKKNFCLALWEIYEETKRMMIAMGAKGWGTNDEEDSRNTRVIRRDDL